MFLLNFFKHLIYLSFEGVQFSPTVQTTSLPLEVGLHVPDTSRQPRDLPHGTPQFSSPRAAEPGFFSLSLTKTKNQNHLYVSDTDIKRVIQYVTLPYLKGDLEIKML